jgi:hypothetical protein
LNRIISIIPLILIVLCALFLLGIGVVSFAPASIVVTESQLYFGAVFEGMVTKPQNVDLEIRNPLLGTRKHVRWRAIAEKEWLSVRPSRGMGKEVIQIGAKHSRLEPGNYKGRVKIFDTKAEHSPKEIEVLLRVYEKGSSSPPFGFIDIPRDHQDISGTLIKVEGWALDDIEVVRVSVKRAPLPDDSSPIDPEGLVFLGDAVFREGSRKDVQRAFPLFPLNHRAGWLFSFGLHVLSGQEISPVELHVIALDKEGNKKDLGKRTVLLSPGK